MSEVRVLSPLPLLAQKAFWDKIRKALAEENIQSQIGTYALHLEPAYKNFKRIGNLKNSEKLFYNALTLPLHKDLTIEDQDKICKIISATIN